MSAIIVLVFFASVAGEGAPECRPAHERLHAVLWMQTAPEYRVAATSTYQLARIQLDRALKDRKWSALPGAGSISRKPPAVILDLDETVMDNSPEEAATVRSGSEFTAERWNAWVESASAGAVPGALEFVRYAEKRGVEVFYISGRNVKGEAATRRNLKTLGFRLKDNLDQVLLRQERPDWLGDKSPRREFVAASHRVLLLIGDDLNDFINVTNMTPEQRIEAAETHKADWGTKWIMLPNPMYGSWEAAARDYKSTTDAASDRENLMRKIRRLRAFEPAAAAAAE